MFTLPRHYIREYQRFLYSHYLSEGVRVTAGLVLPSVVFNYFGALEMGILASLGALCASIPDQPGPIHHRKNAMLACIALSGVSTFVTGLVVENYLLLGIWLWVAGFLFTMIGVFSNRAMSIGTAALLVLVLNTKESGGLQQNVLHSALIMGGGIWYMLLSLLLYSIRPYKLAQQALGDCISETANYLRNKALFYLPQYQEKEAYNQLLETQFRIHEKQDLVRELLFKSRHIVKESTPQGRILVMIFLDAVDLFERTMTAQQDYNMLHQVFDDHKILPEFHDMILQLADELDRMGIALKGGYPSTSTHLTRKRLDGLEEKFQRLRDEFRTAENVSAFISLKQILLSLEDIANRIYTLHQYTSFDPALSEKYKTPVDLHQFISHQPVQARLLLSNLSLQSNIFKHALRVSSALLIGYSISKLFPSGHSYWILLTIVVIMKPTFSLTRKRSGERLLGTLAGALIGVALLYWIQDKNLLLIVMILLMIGTFSFVRHRYLLSVVLMTPYILVLFQLLFQEDFQTIIPERVADTAIGAAVAFLANLFLLPVWENSAIKKAMAHALQQNQNYLTTVASFFGGKPIASTPYKLVRKNAFLALANLTDAFNRMLSEPTSQQYKPKVLHQFVVLNHMLTTHIATLGFYIEPLARSQSSPVYLDMEKELNSRLSYLKQQLEENTEKDSSLEEPTKASDGTSLQLLNTQIQKLLAIRSEEIKTGITDSPTRKDLAEKKSISDQFLFIVRTVEALERNVQEFLSSAPIKNAV